MEELEELKEDAKKALKIIKELDEKATRILNDNPTKLEASRASLVIWKALEYLREFLGV